MTSSSPQMDRLKESLQDLLVGLESRPCFSEMKSLAFLTQYERRIISQEFLNFSPNSMIRILFEGCSVRNLSQSITPSLFSSVAGLRISSSYQLTSHSFTPDSYPDFSSSLVLQIEHDCQDLALLPQNSQKRSKRSIRSFTNSITSISEKVKSRFSDSMPLCP